MLRENCIYCTITKQEHLICLPWLYYQCVMCVMLWKICYYKSLSLQLWICIRLPSLILSTPKTHHNKLRWLEIETNNVAGNGTSDSPGRKGIIRSIFLKPLEIEFDKQQLEKIEYHKLSQLVQHCRRECYVLIRCSRVRTSTMPSIDVVVFLIIQVVVALMFLLS